MVLISTPAIPTLVIPVLTMELLPSTLTLTIPIPAELLLNNSRDIVDFVLLFILFKYCAIMIIISVPSIYVKHFVFNL